MKTVAKIGFIGAGKMAEALIARLGSSQSIIASDVNKKRLSYLRQKYKIKAAKDNLEVFSSAKIVILAVKPRDISAVVAELKRKKKTGNREQLVISIAAGIPLNYLAKKLPGVPIVRAMPNNPCLVGMGMTALAKGKKVSRALYKKAETIFRRVGEVLEVPEKWLDAVTGLSGSGPAFVYQAIEALTAGGIKSGLPKNVAARLALQTVLGAAATVKETGKNPKELRAMVTSPGGTTIEGLAVLKKMKFDQALAGAVLAAAKKSRVLSKKWTS
ncbi:pyrroline-5-carboxylate reductase [Candidatus Margulisiibacteriota bacterium]